MSTTPPRPRAGRTPNRPALRRSAAARAAGNPEARQRTRPFLRRSEERFRQLAENIGAVFWLTDLRDGRVVYLSPAYERLWGLDRQALLADYRAWADVVHPEDRARVAAAFQRDAQAGRFDEEYRIVTPTGAVHWLRDRGFPTLVGAGPAHRIAGIAEDITDRRRREERIAGLQALTAALAGAVTAEQVGAVIVERGGALLGAEIAVLARLSGDGREFVTLRMTGYPPEVAADLRRIPVARPLVMSEAVRRGEPVFVETGAERAARYPSRATAGAAAAAPLLVDGRLIGALGLGFAGDRTFTDEDRDAARTIAALGAQALERARLYDVAREASAAAEGAEARYRGLFDGAADAILVADGAGRYIDANPAALALLGYPRDALLGRSVADVLVAADGADLVVDPPTLDGPAGEAAAESPAARAGVQVVRRGDGSLVEVEARAAVLDAPGGTVHWTALRDVAERRQTEDALRRQAVLLDHAGDAIFAWDWDGTVTFWNQGAETLYGFPREAAVGRLSHDLLQTRHPDGRERFLATLARDGTWEGELEQVRRDGTPIVVETRHVLVREGDRAYVIEANRDVTARRALAQLQEDFLASASHDLRNPLGVIKTQAQLLRRRLRGGGPVDPARFAEGVGRVETQADKIAELIDELVDVARLRAGQPVDIEREPFDLVALTRQVVDEYRRTSTRHPIRIEAPVAALIGVWDRRRMDRVLANLLTNAIKYSPDGGEIDVRITVDDGPNGGWANLAVQDHGVGIPAADLPHVFERFRRGANVGGISGAGIGLAGARRIVEQQGGTITVESTERHGSTFTVRLPRDLDLA
ncbi:MAG: hypothetical protein AVDCRST_MAG49-3456 [uncultured Thermomicrobiales bacterium]|uniref:histidine kinase n=1 Tax=uncultured Thermomicrobiales bacterium TaxID=1645740 RepID=A0A6J4V7J2_9BACT|nr:MAG: hypothetical protein AVDCRST_MAG49-3456 [uncultured Thermomicrobiales bacterium]